MHVYNPSTWEEDREFKGPPEVVVHIFDPSTLEIEEEDFCKSETSLRTNKQAKNNNTTKRSEAREISQGKMLVSQGRRPEFGFPGAT